VRAILAGTVLFCAMCALFIARCAGPHPAVRAVSVERANGGWRVVAEIVNEARGSGQIGVVLRLRDLDGGATREREERTELGPHERVEVIVAFDAPAEGRYAPEVEARYPAR
jgi:hypothetical protein